MNADSRYVWAEVFMSTSKINLGLPLAVLEMLARVGSIASTTLLIMLFWNDILNPSDISATEWVGLLFFPFGVATGMVVAWWKEGTGAAITVASLMGLYLVYGYLLQNHLGGWAFIVFASPGFLFLLHWLLASSSLSNPARRGFTRTFSISANS